MKSFSQFIVEYAANEIGKHAVDMTRLDIGTHNLDGSPKTPEEMKQNKVGAAKILNAHKQRARRSRLRKAANEYGSTYKG
jgi:hypothetical protein